MNIILSMLPLYCRKILLCTYAELQTQALLFELYSTHIQSLIKWKWHLFTIILTSFRLWNNWIFKIHIRVIHNVYYYTSYSRNVKLKWKSYNALHAHKCLRTEYYILYHFWHHSMHKMWCVLQELTLVVTGYLP